MKDSIGWNILEDETHRKLIAKYSSKKFNKVQLFKMLPYTYDFYTKIKRVVIK